MSERIKELVEYLQGTCKNLSDACDSLDFDNEELTQEELDQLDEHIFECAGCGWWCETEEANEDKNGEFICNDCLGDE